MAKYILFLMLLVAWACVNIAAAEEEEEKTHTREKRQGGFFPGLSFNSGQQGGQDSFPFGGGNLGSFPFRGGNLGFNVANPFGRNQRQPARATSAPQHQSFHRNTRPQTFQMGCGLIAKGTPTRIVGGKPVDPLAWPWMVALMRKGANYFCGGTLITDRHVLTAAHCIDGVDQNSIQIRLGEYNFDRQDESGHVDFNVAAIRMHTGFNRNTYVNDIAILALDRPTTFNADFRPVCLPERDESYEGKTATSTGWGTIFYGGPVTTTLLEVTMPIWTNAQCNDAYETTIIEKQICAGGYLGGASICEGDDGGPLLLQTGNRWTIVGIVSWIIRCGEINNPGVFTRVSKYRDWIRNNAV